MDLVGISIQIIIGTIILAPALWISARLILGKDKANFVNALWIVLLGTIIYAVIGALVGNLIATIILFIIWLALIKYFFKTDWIKALLIAIVAVVIYAILIAILAIIVGIIGIGTIAPWI